MIIEKEFTIMSTQQSTITDDEIKRIIGTGKPYIMVLLKTGPKRDQDAGTSAKIQQEHLRHLLTLRAKGKLLVNGPILDDSTLRGVSIYDSTNKEEISELLESDPAVIAGRLTYEIHSWFGIPGDILR
jgi:uncharacterized protein